MGCLHVFLTPVEFQEEIILPTTIDVLIDLNHGVDPKSQGILIKAGKNVYCVGKDIVFCRLIKWLASRKYVGLVA